MQLEQARLGFEPRNLENLCLPSLCLFFAELRADHYGEEITVLRQIVF